MYTHDHETAKFSLHVWIKLLKKYTIDELWHAWMNILKCESLRGKYLYPIDFITRVEQARKATQLVYRALPEQKDTFTFQDFVRLSDNLDEAEAKAQKNGMEAGKIVARRIRSIYEQRCKEFPEWAKEIQDSKSRN